MPYYWLVGSCYFPVFVCFLGDIWYFLLRYCEIIVHILYFCILNPIGYRIFHETNTDIKNRHRLYYER